jgi:hypothetical protein
MVFPDAFFEFPALRFIQQFQQEGLCEKIIYGDLPSRNKSLNSITALKPGEMTPWRRVKLRGKLWRYLWKAHFISPYLLKEG